MGAFVHLALATWEFRQPDQKVAQAILISREAQAAVRKQDKLVEKVALDRCREELPRWKLAERATERTLLGPV